MRKDYYEQTEENIIYEEPYNWKKHFIFHIPEMMSFFIKVILVFSLVQMLVATIVASVIATTIKDLSKEDVKKVFDSAYKEVRI